MSTKENPIQGVHDTGTPSIPKSPSFKGFKDECLIRSIKSHREVQVEKVSCPIVFTACRNDLLGGGYTIKYGSPMIKAGGEGSISASVLLLSPQARTLVIILNTPLIKLTGWKSPIFLAPATLGTKAIKALLNQENWDFLHRKPKKCWESCSDLFRKRLLKVQ